MVQGGREGAGKIALEQRAEQKVGPSGCPRYRAELEWPDALSGKKSGTAEVSFRLCLFVETRVFLFLFSKEKEQERTFSGLFPHV